MKKIMTMIMRMKFRYILVALFTMACALSLIVGMYTLSICNEIGTIIIVSVIMVLSIALMSSVMKYL